MTARITVVGSINIDLVVFAPHHPQIGETVLGSDFKTYPGGKGANQAVAAARAGAQTTMIGKVGRDPFGRLLLASLKDNGVETRWVSQSTGAPSGTALITVDERGSNTIVVVPGSNGELKPADLDAAARAIRASDILVMQLEIPLETVIHAAQLARQAGVSVLLNPAPAQPLPAELLQLVDFLVVNEVEIASLSGHSSTTRSDYIAAARTLPLPPSAVIFITLGGQGAMAVNGSQTIHLPAFNVPAVDTTAAGDAFVGSLAAALAEKCPLNTALRRANAAGALAVTVAGAQPSLPYRKQIDILANSAQ